MKKLLSLTAAVFLSFSCFTGCGSNDKTNEQAFDINEDEGSIIYHGDDSVITLPNCKEIKSFSCDHPENITKIILPSNTSIYQGAIDYWGKELKKLTEYDVADDDPKLFSDDGVIYFKDTQNESISPMFVPPAKTDIKLIDETTDVFLWDFNYWQGSEITIPNNVDTLMYIGAEFDHEVVINISEALLNKLTTSDKEDYNDIIKDDNIILKCNGEIINPPSEPETETETETEATSEKKIEITTEFVPNNKIDAKTLYSDYNKNAAKADSNYLNKEITIRGKVKEVKNTSDYYVEYKGYGSYCVEIVAGSRSSEYIKCYFNDKNSILDLKPGDYVTIKGICLGNDTYIDINNCILVK